VPFKVTRSDRGVPVIVDPAPGEQLIVADTDEGAVSEAAIRAVLRQREA
jgi:hypothetical protein